MTPRAPPRTVYGEPMPLLVVRGNGQLVFSAPHWDEVIAEFPSAADAVEAWKAASDAVRDLKTLLRYG